MVVDGSDLVDLDADLLDLLSSWEGQRPFIPPGMRVPCAPDRRKHEDRGQGKTSFREQHQFQGMEPTSVLRLFKQKPWVWKIQTTWAFDE